jgi:(E)-4-hydroxy-3-methyl-but-2-enyl pyrophosphate reductase
MKIITATTAGFCMGVRRAVDLALEQASRSGAGVYTLGPLIHNTQTVEMLRQRGIRTINEATPVPDNPTILIRAHGVPPDVQRSWKPRGRIIDGTCPKVKTVHRTIEKYRDQGYSIIIAGDEGHAEVVGLLGYAGASGHLISSPGHVDALPAFRKICVVSQTTFDNTTFDEIAERVRARFGNTAEVVVKKTICSATDRRQAETRELAKKVDAMIVVGGKNSANTKRLAAIAKAAGTPVQWVETEDEIAWDSIASCKTVGITAGASTPNWMIKRIIDYLQYMDRTKKKTPVNRVRYIIDILFKLNILVATGAALAYYASCVLQGLLPTAYGFALSFLYFFSMYLWNSLTSMEATQHLGVSRYRFYSSHTPLLYTLVGIGIALVLIISFLESRFLFYLMLFSTLAGSVYHVTLVPAFLRRFVRYGKLKDIPTSRDLFVALAWAIVLTLLPYVRTGALRVTPVMAVCFMFIFVLAFLRSVIFDMRDIEGDRIMGRETLVTIVGEPWARRAIIAAIILTASMCVLTPLFNPAAFTLYISAAFFLQILPLLYMYIFIRANREHRISRSVAFNLLADGQFYLAGLCAWVAGIFK